MIRKNEPYTISVIKLGAEAGKIGACEYQMPQAMATELLKERK